MKLNKAKILFGLIAATGLFITTVKPVEAALPNFIYSGVEGGEAVIEIPESLYSEKSSREWYVNDMWINPVPTGADISKGTTARLKIKPLSTANNGQIYYVKDTTEPEPAGTIKRGQTAMLQVASVEDLNNGELAVLDITDQTVGDTFFAKNLTLVINGTAYPNFQSLRFLINGNEFESIQIPDRETVYTVIETVTGKAIDAKITGVSDSEGPAIKSLRVANNLEDKFALEKKLEVTADDNIGLPSRAYYWEMAPDFAILLKDKILEGAKSRDLSGIAWTKDTSYEVKSNGTYTVFVRDKAGNITFKDIVIKKISSSIPEILSVAIGKSDGKAYFDVKAEDKEGQPLQYKLNKKGSWQSNPRLKGVKDGENTIYVMNEAGMIASTTRTVKLSLFLGEYEKLSEDSLYNYITITPSSWTSGGVKVTLELPKKVKEKLTSMPYSINGGTYGTQNTIRTEVQGDKIKFAVKDIYGNIYEAKPYEVTNIDKEHPTLSLVESEGTINIGATDGISGIARITISGKGMLDNVLKSNSSDKVKSENTSYKATSNGTYKITVTDFAGNQTSATSIVSAFKPESIQGQNPHEKDTTGNHTITATGTKPVTTVTTTGTGTSNAGTNGKKIISSSNTEDDAAFSDFDLDKDSDLTGNETSISDAGHTPMRESVEAKSIEVNRTNGSIAGQANMIQKVELDDSDESTLKKVLILLPVALISAISMVLILNRKKK